jgi:phage terminase large subunit
MKSYEEIIIHPRCTETAREFRVYSHVVDKKTGDVTPKIVDANNHYIDSARYALAPIIRSSSSPKVRQL